MRTKRPDRASLLVVLMLLLICLAATSAASQGPEEGLGTQEAALEGDTEADLTDREFRVPTTTTRRGHAEGASPGFDALLQLPRGFVTTAPRMVAGAAASEWRRRFVQAERDRSEAQTKLEETKRELDGVSLEGGANQWSIAPPGGESSPSTSPLSFKLRQQLREDRERIKSTEKAMRGLQIEANLAGVPQSWRTVNPDSAESGRN